MVPTIPQGSLFSPDSLDLIRSLVRYRVRYLVVGGGAVILYGHARMTGDVDVFYGLEDPNPQRLFQALSDFWQGSIPDVTTADDLADPGVITQFGCPPNRIDLINQIDGVSFEEAWSGRLDVAVETGAEPLVVSFIGRPELIKNKRASGRPKDLDDLRYL